MTPGAGSNPGNHAAPFLQPSGEETKGQRSETTWSKAGPAEWLEGKELICFAEEGAEAQRSPGAIQGATDQLLLFPLSILFLLICFQHPTPQLYQELRGDHGLQ